MSRYELIRRIQIELERLNAEIDVKIIKGTSYRQEARRHKFLMARLAELTQPTKSPNWMQRAAHAMSMFVF
ncbi:MAG: hypothetical protein WC761_05065 [Candidatus Paceibacterota bacterium]|jgi:hypothetical protein